MSAVTLDRADIGLWADFEATRLTIQRLQAYVPQKRYEQAFVRFEGDVEDTGWRGEGVALTMQMTARFLATEHAALVALLDLFDAAHAAADGRLMLRTHLGAVAGLDPITAVLVNDVSPVSQGAGTLDLSFSCRRVAASIEA